MKWNINRSKDPLAICASRTTCRSKHGDRCLYARVDFTNGRIPLFDDSRTSPRRRGQVPNRSIMEWVQSAASPREAPWNERSSAFLCGGKACREDSAEPTSWSSSFGTYERDTRRSVSVIHVMNELGVPIPRTVDSPKSL